jgi:hypothetical protein
MRKFLSLVSLAFVASLGMAAPASANLVVNPGFETGDFTGWTVTGNLAYAQVVAGAEHTGSFGAEFGEPFANTSLSQTLTTVAGSSYDISFWLFNFGLTPNFFSASFGGDVLLSITDGDFQPYTFYSFTDVAASASTVLEFQFRQDLAYWDFDDVAVDLAAVRGVPEPGSVALLCSGLIVLAAIRRSRRKKADA